MSEGVRGEGCDCVRGGRVSVCVTVVHGVGQKLKNVT